MTNTTRVSRGLEWLLGGVTLILSGTASAATGLTPPASGTWLVDRVELVRTTDAVQITEICRALREELGNPLYVITIDSMADHGQNNVSIETFARKLYEEWGNRPDFASANAWRRGILLLVSKGDRKARIELGADWGGHYDAQCRQIMDWAIIPAFKRGDFSGGIVAGVTALDRMARDAAAPAAPRVSTAPVPFVATPTDETAPAQTDPEVASTSGAKIPGTNYPTIPKQQVTVPSNVPKPIAIPPMPVVQPVSHAMGRSRNLAAPFLLFFFAVPAIVVLKLLTGCGGTGVSHHRFDGDSFHGSGRRSFRHRAGRSLGVAARGLSRGGGVRAGGIRFGGGGGASGRW